MDSKPTSPPSATHSKLRHINEMIVIEFFFGDPEKDGIKVGEVALGLGAAMDLLVRIFEEVMGLFPGFQASIEGFNARLAKAAQPNQGRKELAVAATLEVPAFSLPVVTLAVPAMRRAISDLREADRVEAAHALAFQTLTWISLAFASFGRRSLTWSEIAASLAGTISTVALPPILPATELHDVRLFLGSLEGKQRSFLQGLTQHPQAIELLRASFAPIEEPRAAAPAPLTKDEAIKRRLCELAAQVEGVSSLCLSPDLSEIFFAGPVRTRPLVDRCNAVVEQVQKEFDPGYTHVMRGMFASRGTEGLQAKGFTLVELHP